VFANAMTTHNMTRTHRSPIRRVQVDPEYIKLAKKRGNTRYGYE